jgi:hypothetical protein
METCFFFKVDSGRVAFWTTASLSQNTIVELSIGTPNIRSLYHRPSISSTAVFKAINSEPKVDDSTMFCRFEYHRIGAQLT